MSYILKQYDTDLLRFDMQKDIDGVSAQILSVNEKNRSLLPLDLELSDYGLAKWLKRRTIPSNRAYVQNFLAKLGLNEKDTNSENMFRIRTASNGENDDVASGDRRNARGRFQSGGVHQSAERADDGYARQRLKNACEKRI